LTTHPRSDRQRGIRHDEIGAVSSSKLVADVVVELAVPGSQRLAYCGRTDRSLY